jgi:hypothetical protein
MQAAKAARNCRDHRAYDPSVPGRFDRVIVHFRRSARRTAEAGLQSGAPAKTKDKAVRV